METFTALLIGPWGPILIFFLRIVDVSLDTIRVLLAMRGMRYVVPFVAFVQVLIWIFAVGTAIRNLESPLHILGYAAGYATGNFVGLWLDEKLAFGLATVRIISRHGGVELAEALRDHGFGVTEFSGHGRDGTVEVVYTVIRRSQVGLVHKEVDRWDPDAFVTIEEPRSVRAGLLESRRFRRPSFSNRR